MRFISRKDKSLPGRAVVLLGLPSFGNVGQMAMDCLISSLASCGDGERKVEQLGLLQSEWVSAVTGYEEFSPGSGKTLCMPVEVYGITGTDFVLIQQRAPCISTSVANQKFAEELSTFLFTQVKPRHMLILCGASLQADADEGLLRSNRLFEINASTTDLLSIDFPDITENIKTVQNTIPWSVIEKVRSRLSLPPLPPHDSQQDYVDGSSFIMDVSDFSVVESVERLVPGSPLVGWLLTQGGSFAEDIGMHMWVLGKYCREGDNVGDALELGALVGQITGLLKSSTLHASDGKGVLHSQQLKLSVPKSWDSLLGPPLSLSSASMF